ncbi:hypothetical protein [Sporocytophaga myxococcoides]|uniref:hypothetical protein n=1 Tax=Sporocytophaga myxococcoides TaxID=153721 RepID=UPI0005ED7CBC|nr:hypothetical protein [Sporocytophaga myxococcoides]
MNVNKKTDCLNNYLEEGKLTEQSKIIETALKDSINKWIKEKVSLMQAYKDSKWIVDGIVLNKNNDRFLG